VVMVRSSEVKLKNRWGNDDKYHLAIIVWGVFLIEWMLLIMRKTKSFQIAIKNRKGSRFLTPQVNIGFLFRTKLYFVYLCKIMGGIDGTK